MIDDDQKPTKRASSAGDSRGSTGNKLRAKANSMSQRTKLFAGLMLLLAIAGIIVVGGNYYSDRTKQAAKPDNPTVAAFRAQLPELAAQVDKDPKDVNAHQQYAVALYATGNLGKAEEQYLAAIELNPKDPTMHNNVANVYRDQGKYDEAIKEYDTAISLNPQYANAYVNKANIQAYTLKKPSDAVATYEKALQAIPGDQNIQILLALTYENMGQTDKAKQILTTLLASYPNNQAAKANLDRLNK